MAFIPLTASNVTAVASEYKKYAYVFPVNTTANYTYNESTSVMRTDFNVQTEVKEGTETNMLLGLLPHQWAHLSADSPVPDKYSYADVRGEMKTLAGTSFSVVYTFQGMLPTLPYLDNYSPGFSSSALTEKIASLENSALSTWTDSYNEGQVVNQLVQTARIADEMGNIASRNKRSNHYLVNGPSGKNYLNCIPRPIEFKCRGNFELHIPEIVPPGVNILHPGCVLADGINCKTHAF